MGEQLELKNVTSEAARNLRAFLGRDSLQGYEENSGTVRGDCIEVDYEYDPDSGLLKVTPQRLPDHLQGKSALRDMLGVAFETALEKPSHCAVYTYLLATYHNETNGALTYITSETTHGSVTPDSKRVEPGKEELAWTAESEKGSTVGIDGTVYYQLADGVSKLIVKYSIAGFAKYSSGLEGPAAGHFETEDLNTTSKLEGYTYMEPTTVLRPNKN